MKSGALVSPPNLYPPWFSGVPSRGVKWENKTYKLKRSIECFHMTSRRPYWCRKTMKLRPCWCPKPVLWELNSFLMLTLSFVPINLHRCWPREWKHSIVTSAARFSFSHKINSLWITVQPFFMYINRKKKTRWLEHMNFIFSWWKTIFYSLAELVCKILFSPIENKIHIFAPPC